MAVRVPATSANLGPGFDAMGLALALHVEVGVVGLHEQPVAGLEADDHHPAQVAFVRAGGRGRVWVANSIPMGRGLGFSGAARVGGIVAAELQQLGSPGNDSSWSRERSHALELGAELEGHLDNVAPSLHGGIVIASENTVARVPLAMEASFVAWIPESTTSTKESRGHIGPTVALEDAVFNISRAAMLATAFATGNIDLLREATRDRLHQDIRFARSPASRAALEAGLAHGAWCGWLSGSGPTVLLMVDPAGAERLAGSLPTDGHTKVLSLDTQGTCVA